MEELIIDYAFNKADAVANPDNSLQANFSGTTLVQGPGNTIIGKYPKALDFGTNGKAKVDLTGVKPNYNQFCFQFVFQINGNVSSRQNLFECTLLPFAIFLLPGKKPTEPELMSTVRTNQHGWSGPDTKFKMSLSLGKWYVGTVAYDYDTLALFIDDKIVSVHAFPNGDIKKGNKNDLFIGTWADGRRDPFHGCLAAFKWYNGIPKDIESRLDEQRSQAEWFLTYKYESFKKNFSIGNRLKGIEFSGATEMHIQYFDRCAILYHDSVGAAFEMHGSILKKYKTMRNPTTLGYLVSDESNTTRGGGRKSIFSKGGIYWSPATGAIPVLQEIYLEYEFLGESRFLGFPQKEARRINGGMEQVFQGCRMYYRNGSSNAHEVHGSILQKFLNSGGVQQWGYPVTNEMDLKKGNTVIGKFSEFENCTIYWSNKTGAFELHGDIRRKYLEIDGVLGELGFPTSDEKDIPGVAGPGRINTFQKGSILWYGSYNGMVIARPFRIWIGRIDSRENEGWGMGQNDLYFQYIRIKEGGGYLYNKRYPSGGDWSGHNIKNVNLNIPVTITPNTISKSIKFSVKIYDSDPGDDDHLGTYSKTLNAANGWGLRDNGGIYNESFSKIRSFTWSVKPQVDVDSLSETEKWWAVENKGTDDLTWNQCASTFRDIDSDTEWWDVTDWLQKAFYELVVKDVAENGNCFGMAVEGIYARKCSSLFSLPINRFGNWNTLRNEFNIKHSYQVGAGPIWWFLGQFVTGNTHDPKDVFIRSRNEFNNGNNPVICISQNFDFSGKPHCILPVAWNSSSKPWKMTICDPNFPGKLKTLTVNPDNNSFEYKGSGTYRGEAWSGGRFHYMPFSLLNEPPRTPIWDAILLLLAGTVLILGEDAETTKLTDTNGKDLRAFGERAKQQMKAGRKPEEYFVGFPGFERAQSHNPDQILIRREHVFSRVMDPGVITGTTLPLDVVLKDRRFAKLVTKLKGKKKLKDLVIGRTAIHILNDPKVMSVLPRDVVNGITGIANINDSRNFIHHFKGKKRSGQLSYVLKHGLSELKVETRIVANEKQQISVHDLNTHSNVIKIMSDRNKTSKITLRNKLGVAGDYIQIELGKVPLNKNKELALNIKQGISGLEIMNTGSTTNIPVNIEAKISGKGIKKSFNVKLENGARLKPASVLSHNALTISKIERIFGPVISTTRIK